ncbi:MAG: T9SS type A sorting domain-containing protein [Flavobacteriales bacterium]|nr:T9SS type A sorting domain-containing protein [Flavobacteriales bacterium]
MAQFSVLDESFSGDGKVTTDLGTRGSYGNAMKVLPDGRYLVTCEAQLTPGSNFCVMRFLPNGDRDPAFGSNGEVVISVGGVSSAALAMAIQPDGRIVLAGWALNGSDKDLAIARLHPDGSMDGSFSGDGMLMIPIGSGDDEATGVGILMDGRIIVGGTTHEGSDSDFAVAFLLPDGTMDMSFGTGGIRTVSFAGGYAIGHGVAVQPDGRILQVGYAQNGLYADVALVRYQTDGTLDLSFGTNGIVTADIGPAYDRGFAITLQADGRILVAGSSHVSSTARGMVARFLANGALDTSFHADGVVNVTTWMNEARAIDIGPDGRIYLTGNAWWGLSPHTITACILPNGNADPDFGWYAGIVIISFGLGTDMGRAVAALPDGKVLVAGYARNDISSTPEVAIHRLGINGYIDPSFGTSGRRTVAAGARMDIAFAVSVQPDQRILLAGSSVGPDGESMAFVRHQGNGSLDLSFGSSGRLLVPIGENSAVRAVATRPNGRIVAAGHTGNAGSRDLALVQLLSTGIIDPDFGLNGTVVQSFGAGDDEVQAMHLAADGSVLIVGSTDDGSGTDLLVARYDATGALDTDFGQGGWSTFDLGGDERASAIRVLSDGRIMLAGDRSTIAGSDIVVARLLAGGSLDPSFGSGGVSVIDLGAVPCSANAIIMDVSGRTIVTGGAEIDGSSQVLVARLEPDGNPDATFSGDGWTTVDAGPGDDVGRAVLVRTDGVILVAGSAGSSETGSDMVVLRFDAEGELMTTFSGDGILPVDIAGDVDHARAMSLEQDGDLVIAGNAYVTGSSDFAVIRFNYNMIVMDDGSAPARPRMKAELVPNPVQANAALNYRLSTPSRVSISVHDLSGRMIEQWHSGERRASGRHQETLDLEGLSAGTYIVRLSSLHGNTEIKFVKQ